MEFTTGFANVRIRNNPHWGSVQRLIHPCDANVDLILKTETRPSDMEKASLLIGEAVEFPHEHNTRWTSVMLQSGSVRSRDLTKYDSILCYGRYKTPQVLLNRGPEQTTETNV